MNTMSNREMTSELSPSTEKIIESFHREYVASFQDSKAGGPVSRESTEINNSDYLQMCIEMMDLENVPREKIAETILPDSLLEKNLRDIEMGGHVKVRFPTNHYVKLAILPFTLYGHKLKEDELKAGHYLSEFIVQDRENGETVGGFSPEPSFIHRLLPSAFSQGDIRIEKYASEGILDTTEKDLEIVRKAYREAYEKLREAVHRVAISH